MKPRAWILFALVVAFVVCCGWLFTIGIGIAIFQPSQTAMAVQTLTPTPGISEAEICAVAVVLTYEAQVFPEPYRTQAYTAIAWTMRNRIEIGFAGAVDYTDDRLLSRYSSYADHKNDSPDPHALEIARQVLNAPTNDDDPTHGARHYVDNSYWTGTHVQIGSTVQVRGKFSDADLQRLINNGNFLYTIEWRTTSDYPKGLLYFGLYFFDSWPPPVPVVTPTFTPTPRPTSTRTRTPTRTFTPTITRTLTATPTISGTLTITPPLSATPTVSATIDLPIAH